ncbi:uncharacterized protein GGS22DRAFT_152350 [Annulohypoxylon maeteangense]|uniref:uncharacterized protein n=1 Tax=Annulohypoxylon maeteangense TaxID=1927788 RepID=UPI002008BB39|nr:uncharacterized protein GGS22DRAFT_152350 [Annulohypoxylon maeteangense]KAI0888790.1 hypothetical protein GGS22DRAFT_152350 [Annulohypoxylon maeteangense]
MMALHYPLNGLDLDFRRYEHKPLGARDIMVNRIMEHYMEPTGVTAKLYGKSIHDTLSGEIKPWDRLLGTDIQVLSKILQTDYNWPFNPKDMKPLAAPLSLIIKYLRVLTSSGNRTEVESAILGLVERHFLESNPSMRIWLKHVHSYWSHATPKRGPGWKKDVVEHLRRFQAASETQYRLHLYSGGHYLPINVSPDARFFIGPSFTASPWFNVLKPPDSHSNRGHKGLLFKMFGKSPLRDIARSHRGRPQRSGSVPPVGAWGTVAVRSVDNRFHLEKKFIIYFVRRRLSELDKLSRRRSLSRTHIREMFTDKPELFFKQPTGKGGSKPIKHRCDNCAQYTHRTENCPSQCGFCGSPFHKASSCQVKSSNRCKCRPFPQYHVALECYIRCSRACGCPHHPGHFRHNNAMMCSFRCCMCGIKGHSGRKCSFKKCPCGEQHLTQDCRWKVECPVKGCNFYLCRFHCRECGKKKEKGNKDHFVGRTCQDCLRNGEPVSAKT